MPAQHAACRAEKQLIAYFLDKHFIWYDEVGRVGETAGRAHRMLRSGHPPSTLGPDIEDVEIEQSLRRKNRSRQLSMDVPLNSLIDVGILISNRPCYDREKFRCVVNCKYGLNIAYAA